MKNFTSTMPSPVGTLTLVASERGLSGVYMDTPIHADWVFNDAPFVDVRRQLEEYFAGRRRRFEIPLDLQGTAFQRAAWAALQEIPFGETISYGDQARRIDHPAAVRAIGLANGRNPVSIIVPCHRVIGKNGTLTGYGGGLERKRFLLDHENAVQLPSDL